MLLVTSTRTNTSIQIDLAHCTHYAETRKVQAFEVSNGTKIRLNLVDQQGTFLSFFLHRETLEPEDTFQICSLQDLLADYLDDSNPVALTSSTVAFASANRVILAPKPLLLGLNLDTQQHRMWVQSLCLEAQRIRQAAFATRLLNNIMSAADLRGDNAIHDTPPVLSLVVSEQSVFTFHSDGSLRHWLLSEDRRNDPSALEPYQVQEQRHIPGLPDMTTGIAVENAVLMTALVVRTGSWQLAVGIRTQEDNGQQHQHLVFVSGHKHTEETTMTVSSRFLSIPNAHDESGIIVGLRFGDVGSRFALFTLNAEGDFYKYPSGATDPISYDDGMLVALRKQEKRRICSRSFAPSIDTTKGLEVALSELDKRWMRQLFRPATCRGTGSLAPPTLGDVARAFEELNIDIDLSPEDFHLQVLLAVQQWRQETLGSDLAIVIQDSGDEPMAGDDNNPASTLSELSLQEERWRKLCLAIFDQEAARCQPLYLGQPVFKGELGLILRPICATAVVEKSDTLSASKIQPLVQLDRTGGKCLSYLESNDELRNSLELAEAGVFESISSGSIAYHTSSFQTLQTQIEIDFERVDVRNELTALVHSIESSTLESLTEGLSSLDIDCSVDENDFQPSDKAEDRNYRLGLCFVINRKVHRASRKALIRYLLLRDIGVVPHAALDVAFATYVYSLSVLWISSRYIPQKSSLIARGTLTLNENESRKKPALSGIRSGHLADFIPRGYTLVFDPLFTPMAPPVIKNENFFATSILQASGKFLAKVLGISTTSIRQSDSISSDGLPELSFLPYEDPALVLRLVSPFLLGTAFPSSHELRQLRLTAKADSLAFLALEQGDEDEARRLVGLVMDCVEASSSSLEESVSNAVSLQQRFEKRSSLANIILFRLVSIVEEFAKPESGLPSQYILSKLFDAAILARSWSKGLRFASCSPDVSVRASSLKRLARAMVDSGALDSLISFCFVNEVSKDMQNEAFINVIDFSGIAQEALVEVTGSVGHSISLSRGDYLGVLYALHVSKEEWRQAAQCMDIRYRRFLRALSDTQYLPGRQMEFVNDLAFSAVVNNCLMHLSDRKGCKFIIGDEYGPYPAIPMNIPSDESPKRTRVGGTDEEDRTESTSRYLRYLDTTESSLRTLLSIFLEEYLVSYSLSEADTINMVNAFLSKKNGPQSVMDLLKNGNISSALILATMLDSKSELSSEGLSFFETILRNLVSDALVSQSSSVDNEIHGMSVCCVLDALENCSMMTSRPTPILSPILKSSSLPSDLLRNASETLLRRILSLFSPRYPSLLSFTARAYLGYGRVNSLPPWVETMALKSGSKPNDEFYGGGLSPILDAYVSTGHFMDACRVSIMLLNACVKKIGLLPEKGHVFDIPYDNIDLLLNLIECVSNDSSVDKDYRKEIKGMQRDVIGCLENHFKQLKLAEDSIQYQRVI